MWNNLRARHYSVLILLAIVALETSAIAIDRFINRESETAFAIESPFQNNPFIQSFRMADASCAVLPVKSATESLPHAAVAERVAVSQNAPVKTISADFIAAAGENEEFKNFVEYSVQPGDSLSNIANLFGAETAALKRVNRIDDRHNIQAGQTIKVPMPASALYYTVRKGDSLSRIASRFRVQLQDLVESNNLKSHMLVADQRIKIPVSAGKPEIAIVKPADSMIEVGKKLDMVREARTTIVPEQKLEMIKLEKVQMAIAPAAKPKIEFVEKAAVAQTQEKAAMVSAVKPVEVAAVPAARMAASKLDNAPQTIAAPKIEIEKEPREVAYTVAQGDSLLKIANRFNTTVAQLQADNNLKALSSKSARKSKSTPTRKCTRCEG